MTLLKWTLKSEVGVEDKALTAILAADYFVLCFDWWGLRKPTSQKGVFVKVL